MSLHLLQSAHWPTSATVGVSEALFFRAEPRREWLLDARGGAGTSHAGASLAFGTFFGGLSLTTWCGPAGLDEITIELQLRGRCTVEIYADNGYEEPQLLRQQRVTSEGGAVHLAFSGLRARRGVLYPVLRLQPGDSLDLHAVRYWTPTPPPRQVRLAIVMPTFKRDAYVRQNVQRIAAGLLAHEPRRCKLFVIDNAESLQLDPVQGVELVRNPNFGGSGGFARGLLEVERDPEPFTHALFCDDDVTVDPLAIQRVLALAGYLEQDCVVAGGMLKMGKQNMLHEKSANVVGMYFSSNRSNDDLTKAQAVARYDESTYSTFCGWWFVCYPLRAAPQGFMPFPFFVGWDDVEMGLRCDERKLRTVTLLGVAIWHEEFEKKDVNWRWYYHSRNGLVTAALYESGTRALRQSWIEIMTALLTYRYERAEYMIDGLLAVAEGPEALRSIGADQRHRELLERQHQPFTDVSREVIPDRYLKPLKPSRLRKLLTRLTMNGHLLPRALFKSAERPSHPGWVVENLHSRSLVRIFRSPKVVYYEPTSGKGMVCTVDHARYYRLLGRLLRRWLALRLRWSAVREGWRAEHAHLTSAGFWRDYLGLRR